MTISLSGVTAAMDSAAVRMLARWFSAVIGCPRRSSALPPSAITMRMSSSTERGHQDSLDGVHPILGLLEGDVRRTLEDILGDLDAVREVRVLRGDLCTDLRLAIVERGETVHELHPGIACRTHQFGVDLKREKHVDAVAPRLDGLTHRHPHGGVDEVDAAHRLHRIVGDGDPGPGCGREVLAHRHMLV